MDLLNGRTLSQKQRFNLILVAGAVASIVLGILSGYFRQYVFNHAIILVLVGLAIALIIQKVGHGVQTRFAVASLLFTVLAILLSDVVTDFGIAGLVDFSAYQSVLTFMIHEDIYSVLWLVYRALALYISYIYSRVI
ncbi:hypothetical protein G7062_02500 [Erysipelothrix sp. HDW6C]|uniref:hypothetical protein n=1 Tax=Erysipelothrix sp. HDW6C TaxID=2714930 RepID=UPI00140AF555|nr:hypothetical protein [Erysipelothrix sp. HDW6C]QIK69226.1 hypothetical protein G7062_02500 [Erysipelothrix sp. HDW6C]